MKRPVYTLICFLFFFNALYCQEPTQNSSGVMFHGVVVDAGTETPLSGSQIFINKSFYSVTDNDGRFAFFVARRDTVVFTRLGYKPVQLIVSDTLTGREFISGVYMHSDTISIGEVVIVPRLSNLRSQMMAPMAPDSREIENAKYNLALSAYQARAGQGTLGDPASNYQVLRQKQRDEAYTKGQIPSDRIAGLSPFLLIPAAYLLIHGLPEKPGAMKPRLTDMEIEQLHRKYLETQRKQQR